MKELPEEIWKMIARNLKREPPPVGEKGNWNDHFHQQDLVNLMRVNLSLYQVTSAVLYHSPIVQNMGLFLVGLEEPYPRTSITDREKQSDIDHKQTLLGMVRKIHIVHASSNRPLGPVFMNMGTNTNLFNAQLNAYNADELGMMYLSGWQLASDLIDGTSRTGQRYHKAYVYINHFVRLKTVSFGTFDDGRWATYDLQADLCFFSDDEETDSESGTNSPNGRSIGSSSINTECAMVSISPKSTCPTSDIRIILKHIFAGSKCLRVCCDIRAGIAFAGTADMLIVHRPQLGDPIPAYNGPTCVYTTTKALGNRGKHRDIELHSLSLCYDSRMKPFFQAPAPIYPSYNSGLEVDSLSSVASGMMAETTTCRK